MMKIEDIVSAFKKHQLQYGLDGDSGLKELYKWELVTKQLGRPDTDAVDFANEINSVQLQNLCYPPQITAYRNFAKYAPEEYRKALRMLFTETVDLQERVDSFTSTCKALWDNKIKSHFDQNTSAMCDERLISCFLTLKHPQKYTFYKSDVYSSLCNLLGVESKKAGYKLVHFYELLNKYVVPVVENDKELMYSISKEIDNKGYIHSTLLIAQTALWYYVCKSSTEKTNFVVSQDNDNNKTKDNTMKKYSEYIDLLKENHNLVLTGAPGTGKTFMAQAIAEEMGCGKDEMCFVQFHPSYDYTDFVEGLRPIEKSDGQVGFERKDGVFKEFCKRAIIKRANGDKSVIGQIDEYLALLTECANKKYPPFYEDVIYPILKKYNSCFEIINNNLVYKSITGSVVNNKVKRNVANLFIEKEVLKRSILNCRLVSENPKYDEIVEILNRINEYRNINNKKKNDSKPYIFIIDEINRGEISKIFGELFFSIDPGYRGEKGKVKTQYQNLIPESDVFADGFYVPDNVYIIGTMNDIDRSVESMDFAMRRRFTWKEVTPTETQSMLDILPCADEAKKTMNRLNEEIANTDGLGTAYMVGPAYFLKLGNNGGDFLRLWDMNIEPLLKEYLRGFRKSDDILKKFSKAYFNSEETPTEQEESEELE
ncbi:MAG: AAA family ATPase [Prevotella sp.]|nr:AAA family ATPase [Prevotellaceae bacterium]MDY5344124.1 AAA family ATPase [Prevotella sp.]